MAAVYFWAIAQAPVELRPTFDISIGVASWKIDRRSSDGFSETICPFTKVMLYVAPSSERDPTLIAALERSIAALRYGTIAVNHWPASAYALGTSPWGGHPSATLADVQSGIGWVHNSLMLEHVAKTVQRGPLRAFPAPPYFPGHRSLHLLGRALVDFEAAPSALGLARVGYFAVRA